MIEAIALGIGVGAGLAALGMAQAIRWAVLEADAMRARVTPATGGRREGADA